MRTGVVLALVAAACSAPGVRFVPSVVGVRVHSDAGLFVEYRTDGRRGPVLWPFCAAGGATLTRAFPLAEVEGERRDHPHHESCWLSHGDVNGVDCWAGIGAIIALGEPRLDPTRGEIAQESEWRDADGAVICRDRRTWRFRCDGDDRTVDIDVELWRDAGPLRFGDTKEGTMALRLREEFCLEGQRACGAILNSEGETDAAVWGRRARWVAYSAPLDGVPHTVAMFDHPDNHGHPTHWHARGYGLFAANPFGVHDFTGAPPGTGDLVVAPGQKLRLRYRIWIRRGACDPAALEAAWRTFAGR